MKKGNNIDFIKEKDSFVKLYVCNLIINKIGSESYFDVSFFNMNIKNLEIERCSILQGEAIYNSVDNVLSVLNGYYDLYHMTHEFIHMMTRNPYTKFIGLKVVNPDLNTTILNEGVTEWLKMKVLGISFEKCVPEYLDIVIKIDLLSKSSLFEKMLFYFFKADFPSFYNSLNNEEINLFNYSFLEFGIKLHKKEDTYQKRLFCPFEVVE